MEIKNTVKDLNDYSYLNYDDSPNDAVDKFVRILQGEGRLLTKNLLQNIQCSKCGTIMEPAYEGTLSCPSFRTYNEHDFMVGDSSDLILYEFIVKFFNLD